MSTCYTISIRAIQCQATNRSSSPDGSPNRVMEALADSHAPTRSSSSGGSPNRLRESPKWILTSQSDFQVPAGVPIGSRWVRGTLVTGHARPPGCKPGPKFGPNPSPGTAPSPGKRPGTRGPETGPRQPGTESGRVRVQRPGPGPRPPDPWSNFAPRTSNKV